MVDRLHWNRLLDDQRPVQFTPWNRRIDFPVHDHDFYEIAVVAEGTGLHHSAAGTDRLQAGSFLLLPPGAWHRYSAGEGFFGFDCIFARSLLYKELAWITDDPVLGGILLQHSRSRYLRRPVVGAMDPGRLELLVRLLRDVCRLPREVAQQRRTWSLGVLATVLGGISDALRTPLHDQAPRCRPEHRILATRILALIGDDLTRTWSLDSLAGAAGVSPSSLTRSFRAATGRTPMAACTHARIEQAASLLIRTGLPVADIAARVGILDANYFARRFRLELGATPSAYRLRFQAEDPGGDGAA